jgi:hypothetical protein
MFGSRRDAWVGNTGAAAQNKERGDNDYRIAIAFCSVSLQNIRWLTGPGVRSQVLRSNLRNAIP